MCGGQGVPEQDESVTTGDKPVVERDIGQHAWCGRRLPEDGSGVVEGHPRGVLAWFGKADQVAVERHMDGNLDHPIPGERFPLTE
jgi:hypothetical protein